MLLTKRCYYWIFALYGGYYTNWDVLLINECCCLQLYSRLHQGAKFDSFVFLQIILTLICLVPTQLENCFLLRKWVHFAKVYLRTILFILVSLVSGMRIVFATQNQVRQCGPGIPTSPLQSMYWKFSRDIHFPIYSCCALEADYSTTLSVKKKSQIAPTFDCAAQMFSGLPCTTFL